MESKQKTWKTKEISGESSVTSKRKTDERKPKQRIEKEIQQEKSPYQKRRCRQGHERKIQEKNRKDNNH